MFMNIPNDAWIENTIFKFSDPFHWRNTELNVQSDMIRCTDTKLMLE